MRMAIRNVQRVALGAGLSGFSFDVMPVTASLSSSKSEVVLSPALTSHGARAAAVSPVVTQVETKSPATISAAEAADVPPPAAAVRARIVGAVSSEMFQDSGKWKELEVGILEDLRKQFENV